jgi:hypothetical protein
MADSVGAAFRIISIVLIIPDRVFAHAVNTVKKIPRAAGSSRPPLADRLLVFTSLTSLIKVVWIVQTSYRG